MHVVPTRAIAGDQPRSRRQERRGDADRLASPGCTPIGLLSPSRVNQ